MPEENESTPLTTATTKREANDSSNAFACRQNLLWLGGTVTFLLLVKAVASFLHFQNRSSPSLPDDDWMPDVKLEGYSLPITTDSADIQDLFDAGLVECFGFAFPEARDTAQKALALASNDNACPMCYWLLSMSYGPYINHPAASAENYQDAAQAAQKAVHDASLTEISPKEHGLINAIHLRFNKTHETQTIGYQDYQQALEDLHAQMPQDCDVMAFLADAIMIIHCDSEGYHFYEEDNATPLPGIARSTQLLEQCPDHPLGQHLYIHITEPSDTPTRAERTADRLAAAVYSTQAQHLQHMPSHTYWRTGRYHDAILSNIRAHQSDQAYLHHNHLPYGPAHDTAFLVHAAQTSGEQKVAYDYADQLKQHYIHYPDAPDYPGPELGWHIWRTVRLRFGDYLSVLTDTDELPRDWPYAKLLGHYSKGVALLVAKKDNKGAQHHLESLQAILPSVDESLQPVAAIANWTLASAMEYWNGNLKTAMEMARSARTEQESWAYTEPPAWHMTVAQCEATILLRMGNPDAAIEMFQHDLQRIPKNRQSLHGLWKSLVASNAPADEIEKAEVRLKAASKYADDPNRPPVVCPQLGE